MNPSARSIGRLLTAAVLCLIAGGVRAAAAANLVVDDDGFASFADCNDPNPTFMTISAAIAAASSGDTIKVCPGTYTENVVLNKSLTLLGAQAGVDARGRVASESIVTSPSLPATRTLELRTGSAGSIINGFEFLGGTRAIESTSGPLTDLQILNNRILGFTNSGVFLNDNGINITVNQNEIDGTAKVGNGDLFHLDTDNFDGFWFTNNEVANGLTASGFFVDGARNADSGAGSSLTPSPGARTPLFSRNFIHHNQTGVNLGRRAWGDGPITGNTFSNNTFDGLQGGPKDSAITQNTFDLNGRSGLAFTSFARALPDDGARNNTVTQNCFIRNGFTQNGEGIFFSASQPPNTISTNVAHMNNVVGNNFGARYNGLTEIIDAEQNWWGSPTGPFNAVNNPTGTGNGVSNNIDAYPFLSTGVAGTPCSGGPSASLTLSPKTATNPVGTQHCVTATVTNAFGVPQPNISVVFTVSGSVNTMNSVTTDGNGEATFCYFGPALPGGDIIEAFADDNPENGTQDPGEPFDTAEKTWVLPVTTPGCEIIITNGGWIIATNGDRANFGGNAKSDADSNVSGQEEYQDKGPADPFNLHGDVLVITCGTDATSATVFGQATIDGTGSFNYRIDVRDLGEPGAGQDHYRMQVDTGYDSGDQTLQGGNVQIHEQ